jgi:preprotein translocase subunit SecF
MRSVNSKIDFVGNRKWFFLISGVIILAGVLSLLVQGLNLGIDFKSGTRLDITMDKPVGQKAAQAQLEKMGYANPDVTTAGGNGQIVVFQTTETLDSGKVDQIRDQFSKAFHQKVQVEEQKVDPLVGRELARNAIISVLIASLGIILYVTLRFEYRFAVAAVLALFYDALFIISVFSLLQLEVNLVFIAAVLTIVGYSVNDTIVIFDRIRENMDREKPKTWEELTALVNISIQQTLVRSINTVLTVVFAAAALYFFGGESIKNFSFALLLGLFSGAYSSICIASQVWVGWRWRSMQRPKAASGS